jgi:hypothetical protein
MVLKNSKIPLGRADALASQAIREAQQSGVPATDIIRVGEQSQRRDLKDVTESTAGIIPGDRGMVGGSWCHPPLQTATAE